MRPSGGTLRARLIALLLATLIPLVGLGIYWIVMEVRQEQARTEQDTQKTAALVSVEAGRLVSATQGMLAVLSRLPAVQKPDPREAARLFREILANSTHLENIALVGAGGVVLASAVPVPPIGPIHLEDRDWFQRTLQSGQPAVGGYQVGRVAGKPIAVLSHPVLDKTGRVTAVVAAALRLAAVSQEVAPARAKAPIVWAVVDERSVVLLHSEPWGAIGRPLGPLTGMSRAEAVTPGTPWRAVVGVREATVATELRKVLPVVGLPVLLILLGAGGIALWLARDIWRPLQALTATVRRIGAGERGVVLAVEGVGELGMVATALQDALGAVAAREADLIRRHKELAALVDATRAIASSLNLEEILQAIVHQAASISGTPIVRLFLLDEKAQVLRYRVGLGLPLEVEQGLVISVGESFSGQVAATGRPVAVADCREDHRLCYPEHALKYGLISYLGLPVKLGDRVLGVLVFNTNAPRVYSEEEIAYLSAFADHAAIAIENARLHETTVRRAQFLATLNDLSRVLATELDPQRLAQQILASAQTLIPGAAGRLWKRAAEDDVLEVVASLGLHDPEAGVALRLRPGEGLPGIAAATRRPVMSQDVTQDPRFLNKVWAVAEGLVACLVLPLIFGDQVRGALVIYTRVHHIFTDEQVGVLFSFAAQAAIALEKARLFEATERTAREIRSLYEVTHALTTSLDPKEVLDLISVKATDLLGTPHAQVVLWDEDTKILRLGAAHGAQAEKVRQQQFRLGEGVNGVVARNRAPLVVNDYQTYPERVPGMTDLVAVIGVPLLYRGRLLGILSSHATKPGWTFTENHLALLSSFADQAAIAIENARLYDTIRHHATELEARVRQRTAELEEALRFKVEFLGKMSHELRTPLNFVIGFSELLQQKIAGPLTTKQATYIDRVLSGGQRLLTLVNDVLDIAQLDAGKSALRLERVILGPLIQEVLGLVRIQAAQKRLKVTTVLAPWLPFIVADRFKLAQILHNLVSNAVKFTPEDGSIRIITRQVPTAGDGGSDANVKSSVPRECVELIVEDTGIGIRPESLGAIFEPFYQVDGSETRAQGGAGLGLALVRKLVELHGGWVWAESLGPGQGSRFTVRLPRLEVPKTKRILLVEDEALIRASMASALESAGFVVVDVATGADALTAMETASHDLLILDILLPDLDGWQVLRRVREGEEIRTLPVLVVSGLESVNAEQAFGLGADEFLTKPVSPRVLVDTVVRLLAHAGVGNALARPSGEGSGEHPGT